MDSTVLNIVVLPPKEISQELMDLSQKLGRTFGSEFFLNPKNAIPHLTLYQAKYPSENISQIESATKNLAQSLAPVEITLNAFSTPLGYLYVDAPITEQLYTVHKQVVNVLNPLRDGLIIEEHLQLPGVTERQIKSVHQYGHLLVMEEFLPHVTLWRPKDINDLEKAKQLLPESINYTFTIDALHIGEYGPYGTCPKILKSYRLK